MIYYRFIESYSVVSDSCDPMDYTVMEFSRPEYWSGKPLPSPGGLPHPEIKPRSPALQVDSLPAEPQQKPTIIDSSLQYLIPL